MSNKTLEERKRDLITALEAERELFKNSGNYFSRSEYEEIFNYLKNGVIPEHVEVSCLLDLCINDLEIVLADYNC